MKKVEVYSNKEECGKLVDFLNEEKVYWYKDNVLLEGKEDLCRITFYAPIQALSYILNGISRILDFRKRENIVIVFDVETGLGRPYKVTGRRFLPLVRSFIARPLSALQEEAVEKSQYSTGQLVLVMLAALIALGGLALNNPYVIIGAMLISPILGPIYAFSVSLVLGPKNRVVDSLVTLTILLGVALVSTLLATGILSLLGYEIPATRELLLRTKPTILDLILPILLGIASIVAVSSNTTEALTGVAIAAAVVPPTATLGWTLVSEYKLTVGTLEALLLNVIGLLIGGSLMVSISAWYIRRERETTAKS